MKHKRAILIGVIAILLVALLAAPTVLFGGFLKPLPAFQSSLAPSLTYFVRNQSQHPDAVKGCWYDAGDYLVFAHRNAQAFYYLSLAYSEARSDDVRADLLTILDQQWPCSWGMLEQNIKQFRNQSSHYLRLPPHLHKWFDANPAYTYSEGEGLDVALLLAMSRELQGETMDTQRLFEIAATRKTQTSSVDCCEQGPLIFTDDQMVALKALAGFAPAAEDGMWGLDFRALETLDDGRYSDVREVLDKVQHEWTPAAEHFAYVGGSYDVAGTIALERLYAKKTGDDSYRGLSDSMWRYLHGDNAWGVDFANYSHPFHPCYQIGTCAFTETLINGPDENGFNLTRTDIWHNTEIQTPGQAMFVLTTVLYLDL